jgi:hypothetical protein
MINVFSYYSFFFYPRNLQRSNSQLALSQPMRLNLAGRRNQFPLQFPRQALSLSRPQLNTQVYRQSCSTVRYTDSPVS